MLPELSARLSKAIEQKRRKEKLARDLSAVAAELGEQSSRLVRLGAQLESERVDVEKLEHTSLTALFYSVLGSRETQLEKERQELLSVQLQHQQTVHQVKSLERDRDYLNRQLATLADVETEYEALLAEKEAYLRESDQALAREFMENAEQRADITSQLKELSEAIQAGKDVLAGLKQVIEALKGAKNWGTWDLLGGGILSTAVKHNRIDEAREGIHALQAQISQFKRELADVRERIELKIDIGAFETFADFFFDGLIVDWVVQSRIVASLERTKEARDMFSQAAAELEDLKRKAQKKQSDLLEKRTQLIERN
jgi:chromosome segregation ATPase